MKGVKKLVSNDAYPTTSCMMIAHRRGEPTFDSCLHSLSRLAGSGKQRESNLSCQSLFQGFINFLRRIHAIDGSDCCCSKLQQKKERVGNLERRELTASTLPGLLRQCA